MVRNALSLKARAVITESQLTAALNLTNCMFGENNNNWSV